MRNFAGTGVGRQLFHKGPILTTSLISAWVFEEEVLSDVVGGKLNPSLLIADRPLGANTYHVPLILAQFRHITGKVRPGVVALERSFNDLVRDQGLGALRLGHFSGRVVKHHIDDIHFGTINGSNRHSSRVFAALSGISDRNDRIRVTVNRQFEEVIQLFLVEEQSLRFKGLLL